MCKQQISENSLAPPDADGLEAFFRQHLEALATRQAELLEELMLSLTHTLLFGRKYRVESQDWDGDCSDHPVSSGQPFRPADYPTVGDFLEEASGQTRATFVSGYGLSADTLADEAQEELETAFFYLLQALAVEHLAIDPEDAWELPSPADDLVAQWQMEWTWQSLQRLQAVSLSWMLKTHKAAAEQLQAQRIEQGRLQAQQRESEDRIARRVHQQSRFLLSRAKYNMSEREECLAALQSLCQLVSPVDFGIYLRSCWFQAISSNNLRELVLKHDFFENQADPGQPD
ncbi:MAG: hypothetical protein ACAI44_02635 [Candidatus Sericytochromatia bacterium]